jgi:tetratricopeptide (TPR) repeat protein
MPKNKRTIPDLKLFAIWACLALASLVLYLSGKPNTQGPSNQTDASPSRNPQERLLYHNNIGIALLEQFSFREALAEFAQCLKTDSKFVPAFVNSGLAHFYLQEFSPAEEFLKKAVALNPS